MNLQGKIVVITGGSKGFGKALAKAFLQEGSKVIISSNNADELTKAATELNTDNYLCDVTSFEQTKSLADYVINKHNRIDLWINNAGIQIAPNPIEEVERKKLHELFDINFFGYYFGCQAVIPIMKKQKYGMIVNINSTAGLDGKPGLSAYSSSKFAIKGLTESIRKELADSDIKILGIFPGGMQTDIYKELVPKDINEYMLVDDVAIKVIDNLKTDNPELDQIIKRPAKYA